MKRTVAVFALALALSAIAFAHGNEKHVMGTVTSISDNSITVETTSSILPAGSLDASRFLLRKRSVMRLRATRNSQAVTCSTGFIIRYASTNS